MRFTKQQLKDLEDQDFRYNKLVEIISSARMKGGNSGVYAWKDPRSRIIRYVGSSCNLSRRIRDHLLGSHINWEYNEWIARLAKLNLKPELEILEYCRPDLRVMWEILYVTRELFYKNITFNDPDTSVRKHAVLLLKELRDPQELFTRMGM